MDIRLRPRPAGETFTQTNLIPWHVNLITAHAGLHKNTAWNSSGVRFTKYLRIVIKPGPNYDVHAKILDFS